MQSNFVLCLGSSAFLIVDSTFHGQWHVFGVGHQAPCCGKFAWLGNHASLANHTGASVEVVKVRCHYCYLAHLSPGLCSKCSCVRIIYNFGTASYQMPTSKLVLNGDYGVQKGEVAKL